jgi:hypothetical protein
VKRDRAAAILGEEIAEAEPDRPPLAGLPHRKTATLEVVEKLEHSWAVDPEQHGSLRKHREELAGFPPFRRRGAADRYDDRVEIRDLFQLPDDPGSAEP